MADVTHAGGVVMRLDGGAPRYLVITSRSNGERWVFPKGRIDPGETAEAAAEREVLEEAGVAARILNAVGSSEYKKDGRTVVVEFFLMHYLRVSGQGEDRKQRWCAYEEALELLSYDHTRELLRRSHLIAVKLAKKMVSVS